MMKNSPRNINNGIAEVIPIYKKLLVIKALKNRIEQSHIIIKTKIA
jgi:hypothetical protein